MSLHPIAEYIDRAVEQLHISKHRSHLGASLIGRPCERQLYYIFRWAAKPQFKGRMLRLFDRGNKEESAFVQYLRQLSVVVHDTGPDGKQFRVEAIDGHFGGSLDGVAHNVPDLDPNEWVVLEFKTHNAKGFNYLKEKHVQKAKIEHFAQMQIYMHLTGLKKALYLAVNKDNDELHSELIEYDFTEAEQLLDKAARVIHARQAPRRISESPAFFECKYCDFKNICHWGVEPEKSCRSCRHVVAGPNATWFCNKHQGRIPDDFISLGCSLYEPIAD
jgi:CRISPR/Cas system-associated exonuclease Cas4 (RecB family)